VCVLKNTLYIVLIECKWEEKNIMETERHNTVVDNHQTSRGRVQSTYDGVGKRVSQSPVGGVSSPLMMG